MSSHAEHLLGMTLESVFASAWLRSLGKMPTIELIGDEYYLEMRDAGFSLAADFSGRVIACQFHAEAHEGHAEFSCINEFEISFSDSRQTIRNKIGMPDSSNNRELDRVDKLWAVWVDLFQEATLDSNLRSATCTDTKSKMSTGFASKICCPDRLARLV